MTDDIKIAFDPGFGPLVASFSENMEYAYNEIGSHKSMHQKSFKFKMLKPQIEALFKNSISFYMGCLLWASYVYFKYQDEPKEIEGNGFLGIEKEELEKMDFEYELNYILNFFEKYEKDTQYFLRKKESFSDELKEIVLTYKEFLEINDNFIATKSTADIKIPEKMLFIKDVDVEELYQVIQTSIKTKDLSLLLKFNR